MINHIFQDTINNHIFDLTVFILLKKLCNFTKMSNECNAKKNMQMVSKTLKNLDSEYGVWCQMSILSTRVFQSLLQLFPSVKMGFEISRQFHEIISSKVFSVKPQMDEFFRTWRFHEIFRNNLLEIRIWSCFDLWRQDFWSCCWTFLNLLSFLSNYFLEIWRGCCGKNFIMFTCVKTL